MVQSVRMCGGRENVYDRLDRLVLGYQRKNNKQKLEFQLFSKRRLQMLFVHLLQFWQDQAFFISSQLYRCFWSGWVGGSLTDPFFFKRSQWSMGRTPRRSLLSQRCWPTEHLSSQEMFLAAGQRFNFVLTCGSSFVFDCSGSWSQIWVDWKCSQSDTVTLLNKFCS